MHVFQLNLNKTGTHFMSVAALLWMGTIAALPLLGMGTIANNDVVEYSAASAFVSAAFISVQIFLCTNIFCFSTGNTKYSLLIIP